jgi:hypothetical protein
MIAIVTANIDTTQPPIEGQPVGSHDKRIPAACPPTGLNANATKLPMTTFKNPNANVDDAAASKPLSAVIAHVPHRVQRSRHDVESRHACACKIAKRKCQKCCCFKSLCRNKRDNLSSLLHKDGSLKTFFSTEEGCGTSLNPLPPAAAARPSATATPSASVTNDATRSRASTGAPPLPKDDAVAPLLGVDASEEPANPAGVDRTQPPPDPSANTERTRFVHFEDSTDEEDAPVAGDGPDDPDDDDPDDDGEDDNDDDGEDEDDTDWTAIYMMEQQADLPDYVVTEADRRLDKVYGHHPHSNAGTHLWGGVERDKLWQGRWLGTMQLSTTTYTVPKGRIGWRYCKYLTLLWQGVCHRKWNSERPLMFAKLILQTSLDVKTSSDVRARLELRMGLWEQSRIRALLDDIIVEVGGKPHVRLEKDDAAKARSYQARVISGRLRSAIRGVMNRAGGGVLQPDDVCTKTGRPVLEVVQGKHPKMREPDLDDPQLKIFESYLTVPQAVPLDITAETVEKVASHLSGAAGPSGRDVVDLSNWLLHHGAESQLLRNELAAIARWLANDHPPWASYRALMACRLVALDKEPGTRPVGIGEIYRRLFAKCVLEACGSQATTACGNLNICAGLTAGIEGAVHAVAAVVADSGGAGGGTAVTEYSGLHVR